MNSLALQTTERLVRYRKGRSGGSFGPRFVLTTLAVALLVAGLVLGLAHFARKADLLKLSVVRVEGVDLSVAREVEAYAGLATGTPLLGIDLDQAAARVEEHPFVAAAKVRRVPPGTVVVDVTPREPALLVSLGHLYLADRDGVVFKRAAPGDGLDLPVLTGLSQEDLDQRRTETLGRALDALFAHRGAGAPGGEVHEIEMHAGVGVTLHLEKTQVHLGLEDYEQRLARLPNVLARLSRAGRQPLEIFLDDRRRPERVAVRLLPSSEMGSGGDQ